METYRAGEIVLLRFPHVDTTGTRRRPALVLLDTGDQDAVVARVTSQAIRSAYDVEVREWREAGLMLPSVIRVDKVATLEKRLVERRLGALTAGDWARVGKVVRRLWRSIS